MQGKLVERLQKPMRVLPRKGKKPFKIAQVETLHFPLVPGATADKVSNLFVKLGVK